MHVTSLLPAVVDMSSDDEDAMSSDSNDDFSPILLPPGFQPASTPPNDTMLVPLDPAGQQMIGQHILFKWPTYGWCLGKISACNTDPKCKVSKQIVNFTVFYPDDGSSGPHCLSLDNYDMRGASVTDGGPLNSASKTPCFYFRCLFTEHGSHYNSSLFCHESLVLSHVPRFGHPR